MPESEFQAPPPPPLQSSTPPPMSTASTLVNIFIAPARTFASFREIKTFSPAAIRFLIAALIIGIGLTAYAAIYLMRIGPREIARATIEVSPNMAQLPPEMKERALTVLQTPTFLVFNLITTLTRPLILTVASLFLGSLVYWLGGLIFKAPLSYLQALLVWTYATLPPTVLWFVANVLTLFVWPPATNIRIALGNGGVFPGSLGSLLSLFFVTTLPVPAYIVALSAIDLFDFYGLALAVVGLRKAGHLPWVGALAIVFVIWMIGVVCRVSMAGVVSVFWK